MVCRPGPDGGDAEVGGAASNSRHGALEPATGGRLSVIAAFACTASSAGGITEAVVWLPPGTAFRQRHRRFYSICAAQTEFARHGVGDHGAAALADVLSRICHDVSTSTASDLSRRQI